MRKLILLTCVLSFSMLVEGQNKILDKRPFKRDNLVLDMYFSQLTGMNNGVDYKFYSHGNAVSFLYDLDLKSNRTSLAIGLGWASQNYYTNATVFRKDTTVGTYSYFSPLAANTSYETNKFKVNYLTLPFEVRLRSKGNEKNHHWKLYMGGYLKFTTNAFEKFSAAGVKTKNLYQPDVRKFGYGVSIRGGYARFLLSAKYSLSPLFIDSKGEVLNNVSFGITLIPF